MSLENVQAFYARLVNDEAFRNQMQSVTNKDECSQVVQGAGYDFTTEEFEEYTTQLLESAAGEGELRDLSEKELEAVFGGASSIISDLIFRPLYGVITWPPKRSIHWPPKPPVQPLYGVAISSEF